jgi:hypothetical protein
LLQLLHFIEHYKLLIKNNYSPMNEHNVWQKSVQNIFFAWLKVVHFLCYKTSNFSLVGYSYYFVGGGGRWWLWGLIFNHVHAINHLCCCILTKLLNLYVYVHHEQKKTQ